MVIFKFLLLLGLFVVVVLSVVRWLIRFLFGGLVGSREQQAKRPQNNTTHSTRQSSTPPAQKKIIESDEGEYVDFEEIKEQK